MIKSIHHLNCGTMCPFCKRFVQGKGSWLSTATLVCHCLLIETDHDLILVDTGYGTKDIENPQDRLGSLSGAIVRPILSLEETAIHQVQKLGYDPKDISRIIPTHLDLDHIGGLSDFPDAKVHVHQPELQQILSPTWFDKLRFRKQQLAHDPLWVVHDKPDQTWFGFEAIQPILGNSDILMIPLPGHTKGHVGIAVKTQDEWLLHCGDAYYHHSQVSQHGKTPAGLKLFTNITRSIPRAHQVSLDRLRQLYQQHQQDIRFFCAHDPQELSSFTHS